MNAPQREVLRRATEEDAVTFRISRRHLSIYLVLACGHVRPGRASPGETLDCWRCLRREQPTVSEPNPPPVAKTRAPPKPRPAWVPPARPEPPAFIFQPGPTLTHHLIFSPSGEQQLALALLDRIDELAAERPPTVRDLEDVTELRSRLEVLTSAGLIAAVSGDGPIQLTHFGMRIVDERRARAW